ncbi:MULTISPECIES: ribonuclease P protein component [unclassified Pedobacter]|uniref:ribonuclease P protein component n=1 Tax=unclassified Pedobacter TaxID=2628915 RepID=UPI0022468747|nr:MULTISPECIES: ribonuclease P protein component [unclassified Pedobacter]MCX2429725.1 ribonuclease P protein component [Pedobacter sp. GR22-10]MCX2585377.1 ribonuclease P protein component [Pedobacter sp. MR22-3]
MYTFRKEERLCSRKHLDLLFKNGSSFLLYPFRISYLFLDEPAGVPAQVVINVPKKRYKRAVDRNLLKRRIREAYRLNKQEYFYNQLSADKGLLLFSIQYVGKQKYEFTFIQKKLIATFKRFKTLIQPNEVVE